MVNRRFVMVVLLLAATPSAAADYFPLDDGLYWNYFDPFFEVDVRTDNRSVDTVRGREVVRRVNVENQIQTKELWNYWSRDLNGALFLHGFWRPHEALGIAYEPPILWLDPSGDPGSTWSSVVRLLDLGTEQEYGSVAFDGTMLGPEIVTVPAGTFEALKITLIDRSITFGPEHDRGPYALTGARVAPSHDRDPTATVYIQWYVDGVGLVQDARGAEAGIIRELLSSNVPVAVVETGWTDLKVGYRE